MADNPWPPPGLESQCKTVDRGQRLFSGMFPEGDWADLCPDDQEFWADAEIVAMRNNALDIRAAAMDVLRQAGDVEDKVVAVMLAVADGLDPDGSSG